MDDLSMILGRLRLGGRMHCRVEARSPWGLRSAASPQATFHGVVKGRAVLDVQGEVAISLAEGDLAVLCRGDGHQIGDQPGRPSEIIQHVLPSKPGSSVRVGGAGARCEIVCGSFTSSGRDEPPLFALLPRVLCVRRNQRVHSILALLADAGAHPGLGSEALQGRLTEALFVEVAREGLGKHRWLSALRDRRIAAALAAIHRDPVRDWSVTSLARTAAMSRSGFALAFSGLVREPPLAYVQRVRLDAACAHLRDTDHSLAEIAQEVGYGSEASLSKAFRRRFGVSPGAYRDRLAAA